MREESFRSRYFIKIGSSIIIALLNMVIQVLLPRSLSVEEYGYYSYNLNIFSSTVILANLSASNALVAKFAKRNEELGLVYFYLKFYCVEIVVLSVAVITLYSSTVVQESFAGQSMAMVCLGLETAAVLKLFSDIVSLYDAMAIARISAICQVILKASISMFVMITFFLRKLNLILFYAGQIGFTLLAGITLLFLIIKYQKQKYPRNINNGFCKYLKEYKSYCAPLVISSVASQLLIIIMNWSLMRFSGVTEQAMFGAAWQLNALLSYVFSPYAELSKREYSIFQDDQNKLKVFFVNSLKRMFWITTFFACFIGFCSDWILQLLYGGKYNDAKLVTLLIMIYTIYQAWGQMCGAFMLATERTKMNAFVSIINQMLMLVLVFMFQIPNIIWPDGLGAIGIALVYLVSNILGVLLSVTVSARDMNLSIWKVLSIQLVPLSLCAVVAWIINHIINWYIVGSGDFIIMSKILMGGTIYTFLVLGMLFIFPSQVGITREQIKRVLIKGVVRKTSRHEQREISEQHEKE